MKYAQPCRKLSQILAGSLPTPSQPSTTPRQPCVPCTSSVAHGGIGLKARVPESHENRGEGGHQHENHDPLQVDAVAQVRGASSHVARPCREMCRRPRRRRRSDDRGHPWRSMGEPCRVFAAACASAFPLDLLEILSERRAVVVLARAHEGAEREILPRRARGNPGPGPNPYRAPTARAAVVWGERPGASRARRYQWAPSPGGCHSGRW